MASNRSYRKALPQEVVRKEIEKGKGTQFDPYIADIMLQMIDEDTDYNMKQEESMQFECDDYITKPFLPMLMKEIVHNMTERTNIGN